VRSCLRALVFVALAGVPAGCTFSLGGSDDREHDLERARVLWRAAGIRDYTYRLRRICFCLPESLGPAWVTVRGSVLVTEVVYVDGGEPMPEQYAEGFLSVEGLFDLIDDALERGAAVVDVTYDPETGVPLDVFIDYEARMADEEMGYAAGLPEAAE
jgi:hypothetical protein